MSKTLDQFGGLPMFDDPPPPPTGPEAEPHTREEGKPPAFQRFLESDDGKLFWEEIQSAALEAYRAGEKRFSPRGFLAHYRDTKKVRVNNVFSPWFADLLVAKYPALLDIIERRVRKKKGPEVGP
jgi:hypothetical protein